MARTRAVTNLHLHSDRCGIARACWATGATTRRACSRPGPAAQQALDESRSPKTEQESLSVELGGAVQKPRRACWGANPRHSASDEPENPPLLLPRGVSDDRRVTGRLVSTDAITRRGAPRRLFSSRAAGQRRYRNGDQTQPGPGRLLARRRLAPRPRGAPVGRLCGSPAQADTRTKHSCRATAAHAWIWAKARAAKVQPAPMC